MGNAWWAIRLSNYENKKSRKDLLALISMPGGVELPKVTRKRLAMWWNFLKLRISTLRSKKNKYLCGTGNFGPKDALSVSLREIESFAHEQVGTYRKVANRNCGLYLLFWHQTFWKCFYLRAATIKIPNFLQKLLNYVLLPQIWAILRFLFKGSFYFNFPLVWIAAVTIQGRLLFEGGF